MKFTIKLTLLLWVFSGMFLSSAYSKVNGIMLRGRLVDSTYNTGYFICTIIPRNTTASLIEQSLYSEIIKVPIVNNSFKVNIPQVDDWIDIIFSISDRSGKEKLLNNNSNLQTTLLFKNGDEFDMLVKGDFGIDFWGEGSKRLSCQQNLYRLGVIPDGANDALNDLYNSSNFSSAYDAKLSFLRIQLEMKRTVLETYKDSVDTQIYHRIWLDNIGQSYGSLFYALNITAKMSDTLLKNAARIFLLNLIKTMPPIDTTKQALLSSHYTSALLLKEISLNSYRESATPSQRAGFGEIYRAILKNYQGELRDKLIFLAFLELSKSREGTLNYVDSAISSMGNNESKQMLIKWKANVATGTEAYKFDLPNENGTLFSLDDFKGKIIIADFWFNGCKGCLQMPSAMKPVYLKFASNKKIVFISINVDSEKKMWDNGLKTGKYTIPGSIHLSVYGQGTNHPLIRHYNYTQYPQLLIIGPDGRVISAYPSDPRLDSGSNIIALIDSVLLKQKH